MKTFLTSFKVGDIVVMDESCFQGDTLDNWCSPNMKQWRAAANGLLVLEVDSDCPIENPETGKIEYPQNLEFGDAFPYLTLGYHWKYENTGTISASDQREPELYPEEDDFI